MPPIRHYTTATAAALLALTLGAASAAETPASATATLKNLEGATVGEAMLMETPNGVLLQAKFKDLPPGTHAFHFHEKGECTPPFDSAGDHFAPQGSKHGYLDPEGPHAGDMPNLRIGESGTLEIEIMTGIASLKPDLLDEDGASLVIHENADDYKTDSAGEAGAPIACGVIESAE